MKSRSDTSDLGMLLQERMEASCSSLDKDDLDESVALSLMDELASRNHDDNTNHDSAGSFEEALGEWHSLSVLPLLSQSTTNNKTLKKARSSNHDDNQSQKNDDISTRKSRTKGRTASPGRSRSASAAARRSKGGAGPRSSSRAKKTSSRKKESASLPSSKETSAKRREKELKKKESSASKSNKKDLDRSNRHKETKDRSKRDGMDHSSRMGRSFRDGMDHSSQRKRSQSRNTRRSRKTADGERSSSKIMEDHGNSHQTRQRSSSRAGRRRRNSLGASASASLGGGSGHGSCGNVRANRRQAASTNITTTTTTTAINTIGATAVNVKATSARRRRDTVGRDMLVRNLDVMDQMQQQHPQYLEQQHKFRLGPEGGGMTNVNEPANATANSSALTTSNEVWAKRRAAAALRQQS